jgi:hypothetical protein
MTKDWSILKLDYLTNLNGLANVVTKLTWKCKAVDVINDIEYTAEVWASIEMGEPFPETFIEYHQLNQETVISWVKQTLGEEELANLDTRLQRIISEQVNPSQITVNKPFR